MFGLSLLVALSLASVLVVTTRTVTFRSLEQASGDLEAARAAFYLLAADRAAFAAAQARLITALPIFRAHMTDVRLASDAATLDAMADEYRRQLGAHFFIVTDAGGTWISHPGWSAAGQRPAAVLSGIRAALDGRPEHTIASIDDRLFLVVFEPAQFAEEVIGGLTVGYVLDDAIAQELARVTHSEVNLVARTRLSGSSLSDAARQRLGALLAIPDGVPIGLTASANPREIGGVPYVTGAFSLFLDRPSDDIGRLVLLQDWRPTQQFLNSLRRRLLLAGVATFSIALAGGLVFSRRMSRPFKDIADAAGEIASGNWTRLVPIRGSAEAITTAESFNEMSSHLRHWHEQAEDRQERLRASLERFHSVTESARDGIVSTNGQGSIAFWNRSAAVIFGWGEDEALGRSLTEFIADPDRTRYLDALAFASAQAGLTGRTLELTGMRKDGSRFPVELSLSASGRSAGASVTAVVRDATERKDAEAVLRQRETELRQAQKLEAIGLLAGGVAHDFNNVLMAIHGYGELLIGALDAGDPRRTDADEILKAANRAVGLTRQLLAFSRRQVLAPRVLALDQMVAGTLKMLSRLIGDHIEVSSESAPGLGRVRADPGQIEQVLLNLAVNARDAMPNGGKLHIALANVELGESEASAPPRLAPGRYVRLEVGDTGCGMTPETIARIFEPFFTTKREGEGTGLGLATVYGIVQQSGGAVDVESCPGRGTTFRVYLPRCADTQAAAEPEARSRLSTDGSETVLLVEDDDHVRALVAHMLRQHGYTVLEARGGRQALEAARAHAEIIHLLLTDVVMPGMNGRVLAERLALQRPDMRVLFMSGYSDDEVLRAGIQTGRTVVIQKPFSTADLAGRLREILDGSPDVRS